MTLEEYKRINSVAVLKQEVANHKESKFMRENADEIAARYQREKLVKYREIMERKEKEKQEQSSNNGLTDTVKAKEHNEFSAGDEASPLYQGSNPYGSWQTIVHK